MASLTTITACAWDSLLCSDDGGIHEVEFKLVPLTGDSSSVTLDIDYTHPYSITWDVLGEVTVGDYWLYAEAVDVRGNRSVYGDARVHRIKLTIDPAGPQVARIVGYDIDPDIYTFDGQPEADYLYAVTRPNDQIADSGKQVKEVRFEYQLVQEGAPQGKRVRVEDGDENWIKLDVVPESEAMLMPECDAHQATVWKATWSIGNNLPCEGCTLPDGLYKIRAVAYSHDDSYDEVCTPVFYAWIGERNGERALWPADTEAIGEIGLWAASAPYELKDQFAVTVQTDLTPDVLVLAEDMFVEIDRDVQKTKATLATELSRISQALSTTFSGKVLAEEMFNLLEDSRGHDGMLSVFGSRVVRTDEGEFRTHMAKLDRNWFGISDAFGSNGPVTSDDGIMTVDILGRDAAGIESPECGSNYGTSFLLMLPVYGDICVDRTIAGQRYLTAVGTAYATFMGAPNPPDPCFEYGGFYGTVTLKYKPTADVDVDMLSGYMLTTVGHDNEQPAYVWTNDGIELHESLLTENAVRFQVSTVGAEVDSFYPEKDFGLTIFNVLSNDEGFEIAALGFCEMCPDIDLLVTNNRPRVSAIIRHGDPGALSSSSFSIWLDGVRIVKNGVAAEAWWPISDLPDPISGEWCYPLYPDVTCCADSTLEAGEHTLRILLRDAQGREREEQITFFVDDTVPYVEVMSKYVTFGSPVMIWISDDYCAIDRTSIVVELDGPGGDLVLDYTQLWLEEYEDGLWIHYDLPLDGLNSQLTDDHDDGEMAPDNEYNQIDVYVLAADYVGNTFGYYHESCDSECTGHYETEFVGKMIIDILPPQITLIEPVGQPFDNDGDGIANEDGFDRFDDDNDGLYDEDPEDFLVVVVDSLGRQIEIILPEDLDIEDLNNYLDVRVTMSDCCEPSLQPIDNDGDGRYNEDGPNSIDNDGDGLFDEDPIDYAGVAVVATQYPVIHANFHDPLMLNGNVITGGSRSGIDPWSLVLLLTNRTSGWTIDLTQDTEFGGAALVTETQVYWAASEAFTAGEYTVDIKISDNAGNQATLPEAWTFSIPDGAPVTGPREVGWATKQAMIAPAAGGGDPEAREVCIVARDVADVLGYQVEVNYDVAYLQVADVRAGDFLGSETAGVIWRAEGGVLTLTDARLTGSGQGGSGVLACITFSVVPGSQRTTSYVNLSKTAIWNTAGQKRYVGPDALAMHVAWWNAADMNYDGVVDGDDLILIAMAFGSQPGDSDWNPEADLVVDGVINMLDVAALKKQYGESTTVPGVTKPVLPEGAGVFSLSLPQYEIPAEQEISVVVNLAEAVDHMGASINLTFNLDVLEVAEVREGDFLKRDGKETVMAWASTEEGMLNIGVAQLGRSDGVDGAGTLAQIVFKTKAMGLADLQFGAVELGSSNGEITSAKAMPVEMLQVTKALPKVYALYDNFPNPFNPATNIRYDLPMSSETTLAVYNVVGQLVKTLISAEQKAGEYSVQWDGSDEFGKEVASGIYYYVFRAGDYKSVKSMVLLK
jgi:hypothetical protein